ncbi:MAG: class I SAM-dependent methyltransferase [Terracidiphilus sp.]
MKLNIPDLVVGLSRRDIEQFQIDAILALGKKLGRPLSILEAGCGRSWKLDLTGIDYTLTGVDLDPAALELRKTMTRDLDVAILGDLCTINLPEASFDVVYSRYVLEHVRRADTALQNFVKWLKPGGLMILILPERESARGFYTRVLPYWSHLLFYRYILGNKQAGQQGQPPYPTYFHPVIGGKRLCIFLAEKSMKCVGRYGVGFGRGSSLGTIVQQVVVKLTSILTLGKLTADYHDVSYIAIKNAPDSA